MNTTSRTDKTGGSALCYRWRCPGRQYRSWLDFLKPQRNESSLPPSFIHLLFFFFSRQLHTLWKDYRLSLQIGFGEGLSEVIWGWWVWSKDLLPPIQLRTQGSAGKTPTDNGYSHCLFSKTNVLTSTSLTKAPDYLILLQKKCFKDVTLIHKMSPTCNRNASINKSFSLWFINPLLPI